MAASSQPQGSSLSRPSTAHQHNPQFVNGIKRAPHPYEDGRYEDPRYLSVMLSFARLENILIANPASLVSLPSNDNNAWYYPSHGYESEVEDDDPNYSTVTGNWGRKSTRHARWIRKGKMIAWGPGMEEWEVRSVQCPCLSIAENLCAGRGTSTKTDQINASIPTRSK